MKEGRDMLRKVGEWAGRGGARQRGVEGGKEGPRDVSRCEGREIGRCGQR